MTEKQPTFPPLAGGARSPQGLSSAFPPPPGLAGVGFSRQGARAPGVVVPAMAAPPLGAPPGMAPMMGGAGGFGGQGNPSHFFTGGGRQRLDPNEVEAPQAAVEVLIMWGDSVIFVDHMNPPRTFVVGEKDNSKDTSVGYLMSSSALGVAKLPIVIADDGPPAVVLPPGASGTVTIGGQTMPVDVARNAPQARPCAMLSGAQQIALGHKGAAQIEYRGFTFIVRDVNAGKPVPGGSTIERTPFLYWGGSLLVHILFLLMFYFLPPSPASLTLDTLDTDSKLIKYMLDPDELEEQKIERSNSSESEGGDGKRHAGDEGQMGKKEAQKSNNRFGIKGPQDNKDPHMAREQAKEQAANAGILGVLKASTGAWDSPTSPFGRDTALGSDAMSAMGAMMGDNVGENMGFGGLGLRGSGRGGGGDGTGTIGMGNMGTIGHGSGGGTGSGYGRGSGGLGGRKSSVPQISSGTAAVRGSLSKEAIRRVVQRHLNEVRGCYESGLRDRPDLQGRVTIAFIITPTGSVQSANVANSSMGYAKVESCVANAVRRWTFPSPDGGGLVSVSYPFMLSPSGG